MITMMITIVMINMYIATALRRSLGTHALKTASASDVRVLLAESSISRL